MLGLGVAVGISKLRGRDLAAAIRALFASSEKGVWYDPSDLSTMFQDSVGTTPVTAVGQPVGLLLDKSKGLVLGPELYTLGSGTPDAEWTYAAGTWTLTNAADNSAVIVLLTNLVAGKGYEVSFTVGSITSGLLRLGHPLSSSELCSLTAPGTNYARFVASGTTLSLRNSIAGMSATVTNISVKELPGNHATQATSTARPILARHPITGRRNLLTYTEDFGNAVWSVAAGASKTAAAGVAPDGTDNAGRVTFGAQFGNCRNYTTPTVAGTTYTFSFWAKRESGNTSLSIFHENSATGVSTLFTITDDWARYSISVLGNAASGVVGFGVQDRNASGQGSILIWGAQLELGSTPTAYQKITDFNTEFIAAFPSHTLFQDFTGTTPVTAVGQPVGLLLDKSQGLVLGNELVTNGDFSAGSTGWSVVGVNVAITTGQAAWTSAATNERITQGSLTASKTYKVTFEVFDWVEGSIGTTVGGTSAGNGIKTQYITGVTSVYMRSYGTTTAKLRNVSYKELPGYPATQATSTARPILGRHPITGRRNLLTYTEDIGNTIWDASSSGAAIAPIKTVGQTGPTGLSDAARLQLSLNGGVTSSDISLFKQAFVNSAATSVSSVWMRAYDGVSTFTLQITSPSGSSENINVGGTWQQFFASGLSLTNTDFQVRLRGGQSPANSNTADILVWRPQVELGSTPTAYQKVTSTYDCTEAGVADAYYLKFDGVDDWLVTPSISLSGLTVTTFYGVKPDAAASQWLVAHEPTMGDFWGVGESGSASLPHGGLTTAEYRINGSVVTPKTRGEIFTRASGLPTVLTSHSLTGLGSDTLKIGYYPSFILRGNLYSLIVRGALSDATQIANAESYVAGKTGVTL